MCGCCCTRCLVIVCDADAASLPWSMVGGDCGVSWVASGVASVNEGVASGLGGMTLRCRFVRCSNIVLLFLVPGGAIDVSGVIAVPVGLSVSSSGPGARDRA